MEGETFAPVPHEVFRYPELEVILVVFTCSKHSGALDVCVLRELSLNGTCKVHGEKVFKCYSSRDDVSAYTKGK